MKQTTPLEHLLQDRRDMSEAAVTTDKITVCVPIQPAKFNVALVPVHCCCSATACSEQKVNRVIYHVCC